MTRVTLGMTVLSLILAACGAPAETTPDLPVGIEEGMAPPALTGTLSDGEPYTLVRPPGNARVLVFYRSASCGLCRVQLQQVQQNLAAYRSEGAEVIGVTLDAPEASRSLIDENGLGFPLVSVDSAIFERWGALEPEHRVPLPATYIVDADGVIRFRHVGRNASDRTTDAGVLTVLHRVLAE